MNTSGIYGMGINTYAYTNNNRKTTETGNFVDSTKNDFKASVKEMSSATNVVHIDPDALFSIHQDRKSVV